MPHALVDFKAAGTPEERHMQSFVMSEADLSHFKFGNIWAINGTVGTEYKRIAHLNYLSMNILTNDLLYTGGMANPGVQEVSAQQFASYFSLLVFSDS